MRRLFIGLAALPRLLAYTRALGDAFRRTLEELDDTYGFGEALHVERLLDDRFARYRRIGAIDGSDR